MAKIIYKNGHEGENRLESIEGIEIEMLNGQKALIYPKYSEEVMLPENKIASWDAKTVNEIEALKKKDNFFLTRMLMEHESPAAKFVAQFHSDGHVMFKLPTLLAAMELQYQKSDIDELAETIDGADLLRDFDNDIWSCSRYNENLGWVAVSNFGFVDKDYLQDRALVVPTILY